jgi:FixJ family two-component response regulator
VNIVTTDFQTQGVWGGLFHFKGYCVSHKLLLVDDDESLRDLMCSVLEDYNYLVTCMPNVAEAQTHLLKNNSYHCILSDYRMPGKSGLDFLSDQKALGDLCPVVILTGFGQQEIAEKCMDMGALDFLRKPFNTSELIRSLEVACAFGESWIAKKDLIHAFWKAGNLNDKNRQMVTHLLTKKNFALLERFVAADGQNSGAA